MDDSIRRKRVTTRPATPSDWFRRSCRHESGALQNLLAFYRPLLLRLAKRRLKGPVKVKVSPSDLVQTCVWKATQGFPTQLFSERQAFSKWLVTILHNEAADVLRQYRGAKKRDITREQSLDSPEARDWLGRLSASLYNADADESYSARTFEYLAEAMSSLPPHYQLVLRLRYNRQLRFTEIAGHLERSSDAVRLLHSRALKRLRVEIELLSAGDTQSESSR